MARPGRPEKRTVEYFPFFVKDGKTLFLLENKYECTGTGFFTNVMRFLSSEPDHHVSLADEVSKMMFFAKVKIDEERGTDMINLMVKTGKLHKELWEKYKVVCCPDFLESIKEAYAGRKNEIITIDDILQKYRENQFIGREIELTGGEKQLISENDEINDDLNNFPPEFEGETTQTKLNYTKLNKTKLNCDNPEAPPVDNFESPPEQDDDVSELTKVSQSVGFKIQQEKIAPILLSLAKNKLKPDFMEFAYKKIMTQKSVEKPGGLLVHICENLDKYPEYITGYKKLQTKKKAPRASPPKSCPKCGKELITSYSTAKCESCRVFIEYQELTNTWDVTGKIPKKPEEIKSAFD